MAAYFKAEEEHCGEDVEVVLLGSDSVATIERTHSSYFELADKDVGRLVSGPFG